MFISLAINCFLILIIVILFAYFMKTKESFEILNSTIGGDLYHEVRTLRPYNPSALRAEKTVSKYRKSIDEIIAVASDEFKVNGKTTKLTEACIHAVKNGKRIRSIILSEIARCGQYIVDPAESVLFVEYIHSSSLVLDDLPEFDNDALRRGQESVHAKYGPAVAKMAATSLFSSAMQCISRQINWIKQNVKEIKNIDRIGIYLVSEIGHLLGIQGASGGQYMDISPQSEFNEDSVLEVIKKKTATFFEAAVLIGYLISGGNIDDIGLIKELGRNIGTAFQIADDIGDIEKDRKQENTWNFAIKYGRPMAEIELDKHMNAARLTLKNKNLWTPLWESEIFPMITSMKGDG